MTETKNTPQKLMYFAIGAGLPITAYFLWSKTCVFGRFSRQKQRVDKAHDITVEDSFPASDPPSAW